MKRSEPETIVMVAEIPRPAPLPPPNRARNIHDDDDDDDDSPSTFGAELGSAIGACLVLLTFWIIVMQILPGGVDPWATFFGAPK